MRGAAEFTAFAAVAAAVHVALFAAAPRSGVHSSGADGAAAVSLQAAPAAVAEMVSAWEAPPAAMAVQQTALARPLAAPPAPDLPQLELARAPRAAVQMALQDPKRDESAAADTAPPPPPPPEPVQKPGVRPKPRPERPPEPEPQQAQKAEHSAAGRKAKRAAGVGGGNTAGQSGGAAASTAQPGRQARLQTLWGAEIRTRIERRQRYPAAGRGSAEVLVQLTVARDGRLLDARVARSSGSAVFDRAALQAVRRGGFPAAPGELAQNQITFTLPLGFTR